MENYLTRVGVEAGLNLALVAPLVAAGLIGKPVSRTILKPLGLFALFFVLDVGMMYSFMLVKAIPFWGGWPWQYKVLDVVWPVLLLLLVPAFTARRIGLQLSVRPRSLRALAACSALYLVIAVPLTLWSEHWHPGFDAKLPEYLFEAILPGLAEEFVYRGVLLSLLDEAFGRPWSFAGAPFGWGGIIVVALFGTLHGVAIGAANSIHVYWTAMLLPGLIGLVLTWLRERSGSVWPGVLFHNFVNLVNTVLE